jgi:hypothetical protein
VTGANTLKLSGPERHPRERKFHAAAVVDVITDQRTKCPILEHLQVTASSFHVNVHLRHA